MRQTWSRSSTPSSPRPQNPRCREGTTLRRGVLSRPHSRHPIVPLSHCSVSFILARASPCCSPSHAIVLSAHCFPMYLTSFDRHLETLVSTSCLQVSPHVLRSVDTSLNTLLSPALPVEPSSSLAAQRPARRSCLSRSSSPLRSTPSRNIRSKLPSRGTSARFIHVYPSSIPTPYLHIAVLTAVPGHVTHPGTLRWQESRLPTGHRSRRVVPVEQRVLRL